MPKAKGAKGKTVLITGASSGIGEALAHCFAKAGYDLVLVARSVDKLRTLAAKLAALHKTNVSVQGADLAQPGIAAKLAAAMKRRKLAIDILVNNAGVLEHGTFATMAPARHQQLIDLNVSGLTAMLAHFVPPMIARGDGRVLNVASIAAFQPIPMLATYAATKAFVLSITESLAEELKGTGVSVTALCPGVTATNMVASAAGKSPALERLPGFMIGDAADVAAEGFDACMKREVIRVPGAVNMAAIVAARASPKWLVRRVGGALMRKTV